MFVPAEDKRLDKVGKAEADAYIIDLEDSIASSDKAAALERAVQFLSARGGGTDRILVRLDSELYFEEMERLSVFQELGFMLPKMDNPNKYVDCAEVLQSHMVIALIESPCALMNSREIAALGWVDGLAFGAEDYTAAVNMENVPENLTWHKNLLITAAKTEGKMVFDTPCFRVDENSFLMNEVRQAVSMGFDGKLAIHPCQIEAINNGFAAHGLQAMREIVRAYESSGQAVLRLGGRIYEKMHIVRMKKIISENGGR